ncbi:lipid-transfer protein [Actinoplanes utahensis]|uniref:Lipid-transfer protein n=1 Tax=Actinoplanes utahensis TaxID=1869 RepID=A0A0A6X8H0_ACTUT|nr:lipid-transfer protein [Actinoplanes utahensis]KHD76427.1 lipid-transfer protein [Actinoplanes utahensis]GIF29793.1 lipid-transfer protein [Actinoplanes utahensis]
MNGVAVIGFAQAGGVVTTSGVETLVPVFEEALARAGLGRRDIDFWCSGSSDYLAGRAFSFVSAVDAIGAVPPIAESHVEMDAAWALYEAYLKILSGEASTALVYGFGKGTAGDLNRVLALQMDPYTVAPLWPDAISVAALQARLAIDAGRCSEDDMAAVAAQRGHQAPDSPYVSMPLREHDVAPVADGAAAVVLAAGDRVAGRRAAWIERIEHRIEAQGFGELPAMPAPEVDVAALHAPFTHQELLLRRAFGLSGGVRYVPFTENAMFSAGLSRIGVAAEEVMAGRAAKALGHATSGPLLQQNLTCVLGSRS